MNKKTIITLSTAGIILVGLITPKPTQAFWPFSNSADQEQTETQSTRPFQDLISRLVEKFGLNQTEVEGVFDQFHQERQEERQQQMSKRQEDRLSEAVENGSLTEEQKQLILEKRQEFQLQEGQSDLNPEERREAMEERHWEMESWAEENDIDTSILDFGPKMGNDMKGRGMGPGKGR